MGVAEGASGLSWYVSSMRVHSFEYHIIHISNRRYQAIAPSPQLQVELLSCKARLMCTWCHWVICNSRYNLMHHTSNNMQCSSGHLCPDSVRVFESRATCKTVHQANSMGTLCPAAPLRPWIPWQLGGVCGDFKGSRNQVCVNPGGDPLNKLS